MEKLVTTNIKQFTCKSFETAVFNISDLTDKDKCVKAYIDKTKEGYAVQIVEQTMSE